MSPEEGQKEVGAAEAGVKRQQLWAPEPERRQPVVLMDLAELRMLNRNRLDAGSNRLRRSSRSRAAVRGQVVTLPQIHQTDVVAPMH
jgi:hypothetical protein